MFLPHLRRTRRQGVTLIEVVIAIFVLSVGILGILSLFPTGYKLTRKAVDRSISALASRHALARVYGRINNIQAPRLDAAQEPLYRVPDAKRAGVVSAVATQSITCTVLGGQTPDWPSGGLTGYFVVMTSGSADGHIFKITGNDASTLTTSAYFDKSAAAVAGKPYEPVRVGDSFAIIGIKGGYSPAPTKCFPEMFLGGTLNAISDPANGANPENNETRTMPVATYGDPYQNKDLWRYSYGCILSVPPPERPDSCRLDVFVYNGFPYRAGADPNTTYDGPWDVNSQVVGHYVTYIPAGKKS